MGIQRAVLRCRHRRDAQITCTGTASTAHAQWTVAQLLESVIDAKGMKLAKLEGDAAFFWAPGATPVSWYVTAPQMRQRFRTRREQIKKTIPVTVRAMSSGITEVRSNSSPMRAKRPNKR